MTRNEQIKEQLKELPKGTFDSVADYVTYCAGFYDGVTWADKTMIEKACKWLKEEYPKAAAYYEHPDIFIDQFRKAMK